MRNQTDDSIIPNFSTLSMININDDTGIFYAVRIRSIPFSVIEFQFAELNSIDHISSDDLDGIGWVLQHVTRWRELDSNSHVLVPEIISKYEWSQMFLCYARRFGVGKNSRELVSMCGPFNTKYYLTPIDKSVKLYKIRSEESVKKKLLEDPVPREASDTVPLPDMWDWQSHLILAHLYCWNKAEVDIEPSGRSMLFF